LSDQQMPSIDITEDESSPTDSNTNQLSPTNPSLENPQMTNPALRNDNIRMDDRYSTNSERLSPGSWLCLNNPNPQCDS
ncbi:MAG: hypothetical protein LDL41_11315, partial [Coleofasciculus sp. S288]|nr:hypothetical protein [Coleofasciculus sp. S288]